MITFVEEEKRTFAGFGSSFYWAITTVIGSGDASYVNSPGGFVIGWVLAFFGVAIVAALTGAVVGFFIDILLKEGQGMGADRLPAPGRRRCRGRRRVAGGAAPAHAPARVGRPLPATRRAGLDARR